MSALAFPVVAELSRTSVGSGTGERRLVVTIDGTAGTGKTTVARALARLVGARYLDTGAMYRAAALLTMREGLDLEDHEGIARAVREADIHFRWDQDAPVLQARGRDVPDDELRHPDVTRIVSPVAAIREVRSTLVARQRRIGEIHPRLVSEGRDQGTVVFFDADVKFYLDAAPRVRAERRAGELRCRGIGCDVGAIEAELVARDRMDSARGSGPLAKPADAVEVDTSDLDLYGVVDRLVGIVRSLVPSA